MPNGSLIAGFQNRRLPNGQANPEIIFWERNGLRHGQFTLPGVGQTVENPRTEVFDLKFNIESTLLAVHCKVDNIE
jgi:hypothetical protein